MQVLVKPRENEGSRHFPLVKLNSRHVLVPSGGGREW